MVRTIPSPVGTSAADYPTAKPVKRAHRPLQMDENSLTIIPAWATFAGRLGGSFPLPVKPRKIYSRAA
jgi:hypothetical protein